MKIKVCGMRDTENIFAVSQLDIHLMGFVFHPQNERYVKMISSRAGIIPDYSEEQFKRARGQAEKVFPSRIKRVGVFVDDMPQNIVTRVYNYALDYIQLDGNESAVACRNLRSTLHPDIQPGIQLIKTIAVNNADDLLRCEEYTGAVDLFLFDMLCGQKNWNLLEAYHGEIPFLLSGDIGPDSLEGLKQFSHPHFEGINLNHSFETSPGVKDVERLRQFIAEVGKLS